MSGPAAGARVLVEHVSRRFDGRIDALRDVSLAIDPGEFVALTGPSGSGKSTLLQLIGSLDRPDEGRIEVDGVSVGELRHPAHFRRDIVGFVFQLHHLLPALSARANVEVPLLAAGLARPERAERARALLAEVGLEHRSEHLPSQLSGGERQRVALARALANDPRLLLADEPTGALDQRTSSRVLALIAQARERRGMTVLIVSYDPNVAAHADRQLYLLDGRLSANGMPQPPAPQTAPGG